MTDPLKVELAPTEASSEEGVKRQYLPYTLSFTCPDCGERNTNDMSREYLSNPTIGVAAKEAVYCCGGKDGDDGWEECGYEGQVELLIEFKVSLPGHAAALTPPNPLPQRRNLEQWASAFMWLFNEMGNWSPELRKGEVRERVIQYSRASQEPVGVCRCDSQRQTPVFRNGKCINCHGVDGRTL